MKKLKNLNNATLFLLVLFYVALLTVILMLITPQRSYSVKPDYKHDTGYSDIKGYYLIRHTYNYSNVKLNESLNTRYVISSNTSEEDLTDANLYLINVAVSTTTVNDANYFYPEQTGYKTERNVSSSISTSYDPTSVFFNIRYFNKEDIEEHTSFKEEIFDAPKSSKRFKDKNVIEIDGKTFEFQAMKNTQSDRNVLSMQVKTEVEDLYHLDLQTWIEDENGKIYKYVGVYGYSEGCNQNKSKNWYTNDEGLPFQMKAKTLLCKMQVTYQGKTKEILYKVNIGSLNSEY